MCFYQFSLFFSSACYHKEGLGLEYWFELLQYSRWCVSDVSASMCVYLTNLMLSKSSITQGICRYIAAKMSAMFLSLPVKARLEEKSLFSCREMPQGCACTRGKGKGHWHHFANQNFASKICRGTSASISFTCRNVPSSTVM